LLQKYRKKEGVGYGTKTLRRRFEESKMLSRRQQRLIFFLKAEKKTKMSVKTITTVSEKARLEGRRGN
jgi:hypothetical protein